MRPRIDETTLEHPVTRFAVREAVRIALESPLREPIFEAVDDAAGVRRTEPASAESGESRTARTAQGLAVFVVLFVVLYAALRKLTGEDG